MQNSSSVRADYRERLAPSLWIIVSAAMVAPMIALVFVPSGAALALVVGALAAVLIIAGLFLLSPRIVLSGTVLSAGPARIDVSWLGEPQVYTGEEAHRARGTGLSARSWNLIRGGIDGIVVVPVNDPDDPVSVWTLSTRTPDRLAAAIRKAQRQAQSSHE